MFKLILKFCTTPSFTLGFSQNLILLLSMCIYIIKFPHCLYVMKHRDHNWEPVGKNQKKQHLPKKCVVCETAYKVQFISNKI